MDNKKFLQRKLLVQIPLNQRCKDIKNLFINIYFKGLADYEKVNLKLDLFRNEFLSLVENVLA